MTSLFFLVFLCSSLLTQNIDASPNYVEALSKSLLFFHGQRSGPLQTDQQISWRASSGLQDGSLANVDLTGGYYTEGDNVKHNFPMAFTTTMLSWSTLEYGDQMGHDELQMARDNIRWATDYLLKCATATQDKLYVSVGDPIEDHNCWERPEDMDTPRTVYSVSPSNPGSDIAAETAAALAAASMVFREDTEYSNLLLVTAKNVMKFAIMFPGNYSDALPSSVRPFYLSYSGYMDELMWGAAWLLKATDELNYQNFIKSLGDGDQTDIFNWDNKYAGAYVLLSQQALLNKDSNFEQYKIEAESFICKILPNSPSSSTRYTPGGLIYKLPQINLQHVTAITFLLTTYAKYMRAAQYTFDCGNSVIVSTDTLISLSKRQVDYILGENPMQMSYMVGFGPNFPKNIHHRASSLPSKASHPEPFSCYDGGHYRDTQAPNPNILTGAIVGGPYEDDVYPDQRDHYNNTEPAIYINAAFVGPLAYFASGGSA